MTLSDRTEFIAPIPIHSTLHGTVEVGNVGGFWEFGMGANNISAAITAEQNSRIPETLRLLQFRELPDPGR